MSNFSIEATTTIISTGRILRNNSQWTIIVYLHLNQDTQSSGMTMVIKLQPEGKLATYMSIVLL